MSRFLTLSMIAACAPITILLRQTCHARPTVNVKLGHK